MVDSTLLIGSALAVVIVLLVIWQWHAGAVAAKKNDPASSKDAWRGTGDPNVIDPILRNRHGIQNGEVKTWSLEEVKKHNTKDDLFMVIKNKVYDVSDFVEDHPGGDAIQRQMGLDNTEGFSGIHHPAKVWDMIQDYYIGDVRKEDHVKYTFKELSKL